MRKLKIINYFETLTQKQKIEIESKKSIGLFYSFYDECIDNELTDEEIGQLVMALVFYGKTKGREPLPQELSNKIEANRVLYLMCTTWMTRVANEEKNWLSHKRSKKEKVLYNMKNDVVGLYGNKNNMPNDDFIYEKGLDDSEFEDFVNYGNSVEWCLPCDELYQRWIDNIL